MPGLPERLRDLVTSCLEPEPGDRPHAEEVAVALFDVATPEPVEVAPDADPATGLTRRIRERARVERDGTEAEPGADSGGSRRPGGLRLLHPRRRGRGPAEPRPSGSRSRRRLLVALGAVAATAGVVAAAAAWSEAADDPSTTRPAPSAAPGRPPADPSLVTSSPTTAPTEVADPAVPPGEDAVQQLLDARAAAWTDGDVDSLSRAHAAGSPALSQDAGDLASAVAGGYHYAQLDYRLEDLHLVEEPDDSASGPSYEITVTRSAFTVVGPDGVQEPYPEQSEQVRLELRQDGGAWRIWSWGPPAGTTAAAESDL